ncbi:MAG: DUF2339 domain-containing protein [Acidobacteria bacterium]|nr:DUF2339 domain-containing protein [Acidobacteriota bacterium]
MVVLVVLGLVGLTVWMTRLAARLNVLELQIKQVEKNSRADFAEGSAVRALTARVAQLEARLRPDAPATAAPAVDTAVPLAAPVVSAPTQPPVSAQPAPAVEPAVPLLPAALGTRPPYEAPSSPLPAAPPTDDAWEMTVGGNWLNKVGVLVFVIGLALLVGYSMTHVGPAGRIAIGFIVSLTLLTGGVVMERRADYRNYAYGLIAGGWAGVYFTTYAMRAVEAARVLDSDAVALTLLLVVAAGMVWHSLRYQSQQVTALAYVVAFTTLALTPLRGFALVASVPLALSVIVVAQRFVWPGVQVLGIVCTYGLYVLRSRAFGFGELDVMTFTPYAALAVYWLVFEAADLLALSRRAKDGPPPAPIFLLNAAGLVGGGLLQLPMDSPMPLSTFLAVSGVAYLASAIVRARLAGPAAAGDDALDTAVRGSYQGASALSALFVAWAIELRFTGSQTTLALLMQAELLFLSGIILRDWLIRGLGSAVAILATIHAIDAIGRVGFTDAAPAWPTQAAAGVAVLTAVLWYANREGLRARGIRMLWHEWAYTPAATYLVVLVARAKIADGYSALAVLAFAWLLLEAGLRRGREYRYQSYLVGGASALVLLGWFTGQAFFDTTPTTREAWWILGAGCRAGACRAWRMAPGRDASVPFRRERVIAAAAAGAFGSAFVVVLEWVVIDPEYLGAAWAATAVVLGALGLWRRVSGLRWQAYPLLMMALLWVIGPVLNTESATRTQLASALGVILVLYAVSLVVRRAIAQATKAVADVEDAVRIALSVIATVALVALVYNEVRPTLITLTWGLQAATLLVVGFPARERLMRLSGLAVLLACIARLFLFDLPQLEELARIISFVALGAVLLAVSWIYTRYRARIQKFL